MSKTSQLTKIIFTNNETTLPTLFLPLILIYKNSIENKINQKFWINKNQKVIKYILEITKRNESNKVNLKSYNIKKELLKTKIILYNKKRQK